MYCLKCGSEIDDNAKFCNKCGAANNPNKDVAEPKPDEVKDEHIEAVSEVEAIAIDDNANPVPTPETSAQPVQPQPQPMQANPYMNQPNPYMQNPYMQNQQMGQGQPQPNFAPNMGSQTISIPIEDMKQLFIGLFAKPSEAMKAAVDAKKKTAQYIIAGVSWVLMLLFSFMIFSNPMMSGGKLFKNIFLIMLLAAVLKIAYAGGVFLFARKNNPMLRFVDSMNLFLLSFTYSAILLVFLWLFIKLNFFRLAIVLVFVLIFVDILSNYVATKTIIGDNTDLAIKISLLMDIIIAVIALIIVQQMAVSAVGGMYRQILDMSSMFGNLY